MKVLTIGTDKKLFDDSSSVLSRNIEYASKMEGLYIIVFSKKSLHLEPKTVGNLHIYPTNSISRYHYIPDALKLGKKLIAENKFVSGGSIISCQDPFETGLVGYYLKKQFGFPLQYQVHTDFLSKHFKNSILNRIRVRLAKYLIPQADGLRVVSRSIGESIKKGIPNLRAIPVVLPIFVDIEKYLHVKEERDIEKDFPKFKFIVLMASRLESEKRIDLAIQAFKRVAVEYPHAGLVIAGEGSEKSSLQSLVRKLDLEKNVAFTGWQKDLVSYYKTANIFLLTSEYEGYGMTLIEAGASGCPIVTTRVGIADTSIFVDGKNSFVCPVNDVGCFSESILALINDNIRRETFRREMQENMKSVMVNKEEYASRYVILLENLLMSR